MFRLFSRFRANVVVCGRHALIAHIIYQWNFLLGPILRGFSPRQSSRGSELAELNALLAEFLPPSRDHGFHQGFTIVSRNKVPDTAILCRSSQMVEVWRVVPHDWTDGYMDLWYDTRDEQSAPTRICLSNSCVAKMQLGHWKEEGVLRIGCSPNKQWSVPALNDHGGLLIDTDLTEMLREGVLKIIKEGQVLTAQL